MKAEIEIPLNKLSNLEKDLTKNKLTYTIRRLNYLAVVTVDYREGDDTLLKIIKKNR